MSTVTRASAPPMPAETPLRPPSPESPLSSMSSAGSTLYDSPPTRQTALGAYIFPAVKQEEEPNAWLHPQNPVPRPAPHYRRQSRPSYEFPATGGGGDYAQSMERGSYQAKRLSITGMSTYEAAVRGGEGGYSALGRQVVEGGGIGRTYSWSAYPDFGVSTEHHDGGHPGYSTTSTHSYSHYYAADARLVQPTPAPPPPPQQQYPTTTQFQWAPPPPPAPAPPLHHHHSYTSDYGGSPEDHYRPLPHPDHRQGVYLQTGPGRPFVYGTSLAPPAHYVPYTPASSHHMVRSSGHSYHHQALGGGGYDGVVYGGHGEHERESSSGGYGQQSCDPSHISDEPRSPYIYAGGGADGGERPGYTGVGTSLYDRSTHDHDSPRSLPRSSTRPLRTTRRALPPSRSRSSTPPTPARRSKSKIYHPPPSASSATSTAFHMPSLPTDAQFAIMPTKRSRGRRPPEALEAIDVPYDDKKRGRAPKMFLCKVPRCGKWFKRSEHLKRHVRSIHTDEKPFQCQWPGCAKYFSRHDNLNQHLRVHRVPGTTDLDFSVQLEACFGPGGVRGDKALGLTESARDWKEEKGEESWDSE